MFGTNRKISGGPFKEANPETVSRVEMDKRENLPLEVWCEVCLQKGVGRKGPMHSGEKRSPLAPETVDGKGGGKATVTKQSGKIPLGKSNGGKAAKEGERQLIFGCKSKTEHLFFRGEQEGQAKKKQKKKGMRSLGGNWGNSFPSCDQTQRRNHETTIPKAERGGYVGGGQANDSS